MPHKYTEVEFMSYHVISLSKIELPTYKYLVFLFSDNNN